MASIAPDGLEAFARDLRTLRAQAGLDYPEMAENSHYEMKTLAAAAGGLRLPTLPVAVAYVRACSGNVAEWEERWQKLADKVTVEATKKRRNDGEEHTEPPEPADVPAALEPPTLGSSGLQAPEADSGEVYVITSARPRSPGWLPGSRTQRPDRMYSRLGWVCRHQIRPARCTPEPAPPGPALHRAGRKAPAGPVSGSHAPAGAREAGEPRHPAPAATDHAGTMPIWCRPVPHTNCEIIRSSRRLTIEATVSL